MSRELKNLLFEKAVEKRYCNIYSNDEITENAINQVLYELWESFPKVKRN